MTKTHRPSTTANEIEPSAISANDERLLDVHQVARLTNKSVSTMYWLRQTGQGPRSGKLGRRVVYKRSDVIAWIDSAFEGGAAS